MEKALAKIASGVMSAVIIVVGTKIIYSELSEGTRNNIENKAKKTYKAVKESLSEKDGGIV